MKSKKVKKKTYSIPPLNAGDGTCRILLKICKFPTANVRIKAVEKLTKGAFFFKVMIFFSMSVYFESAKEPHTLSIAAAAVFARSYRES